MGPKGSTNPVEAFLTLSMQSPSLPSVTVLFVARLWKVTAV